jgi:hypothetical protein
MPTKAALEEEQAVIRLEPAADMQEGKTARATPADHAVIEHVASAISLRLAGVPDQVQVKARRMHKVQPDASDGAIRPSDFDQAQPISETTRQAFVVRIRKQVVGTGTHALHGAVVQLAKDAIATEVVCARDAVLYDVPLFTGLAGLRA